MCNFVLLRSNFGKLYFIFNVKVVIEDGVLILKELIVVYLNISKYFF